MDVANRLDVVVAGLWKIQNIWHHITRKRWGRTKGSETTPMVTTKAAGRRTKGEDSNVRTKVVETWGCFALLIVTGKCGCGKTKGCSSHGSSSLFLSASFHLCTRQAAHHLGKRHLPALWLALKEANC